MILIATLVAVAAVLLLAVNLYVQSQGTQARIQQELSQRLGTELQIKRISATPWWGLKLTGITIPQTDGNVSANFLEAKTFRLRIRFASLFSRRLVIKDVSLINPKIVWAQNADGKWRVPSTALAATSDVTGLVADLETEEAAPAGASPPEDVAPPPVATAVPEAKAFTPEVRRVRLSGGNFRFLDAKGRVVATFEGVQFRSNVRKAMALSGNLTIAKTSLRDRFFLEQLQSHVEYAPDGMDFSQISAHSGGGDIAGHFTMRPQTEDSPFTVSVKFRGIEANQVVSNAGGPAGMVKGRLEGYLDATGETADPNVLTGGGEIFLREGRVQQYSLLIALGQVLQIEELRQLELDQAQVKYRISPGVVTIDELLLRSPNIRLSATGTVSFNGKLRLESQLAVNEKVRGQLFRAIRDNFQPIAEPGYAAVDFQITGTVERPKTNLVDKLVGGELKDLRSVITGLLGGKSDRKKKKEPPSESTPAPESSATPAAPENASPAASPDVSASP